MDSGSESRNIYQNRLGLPEDTVDRRKPAPIGGLSHYIPIIYKVSTIQGDAGFLPSTVSPEVHFRHCFSDNMIDPCMRTTPEMRLSKLQTEMLTLRLVKL